MKTRFLHRLLLLISILAYVQTTHISDHSHANSGDFEHGPFPRRVKIVHFKNSDMGLVPAGKNVKLSYIRDDNDHFIWIAYKNKDNTYSFQTSEGLMLHCPDFPKGNGQLLTLQYPDGIINQSFLVDYLQYPTYGYYRIRCRQYEEPFLAVDGRDGAMLAVDRYQQENRTAWQLI